MSIFISPIAFHSHGSQSIIRNTYFNVSIKCYYKTILCLCNYLFNSGVAITTESIFKSTKTTETSTAQLIYPSWKSQDQVNDNLSSQLRAVQEKLSFHGHHGSCCPGTKLWDLGQEKLPDIDISEQEIRNYRKE